MYKNMSNVVLGALAALALSSVVCAGDAERLVGKSSVLSSTGMQSSTGTNGIIGTGIVRPGGIIGTGIVRPGGIIGTGIVRPGGIIGTGIVRPN
ncbi:MAG: hypothetical protein ABIQ86_16340 [Steroidobacteraceae bacterium]